MVKIELAGISIALENRFEYVAIQCRDFGTARPPELCVSVSEEMIAAQRMESRAQGAERFSDGYLESICLYREICRQLPRFDAFLFHSAVVKKDGKAYAFAGESGIGKSTHAALWHQFLGADYLNGDKPIFRRRTDGFYACGTPWAGKEGFCANDTAPLQAICFLSQCTENRVEWISPYQAAGLCIGQLILPEISELTAYELALTDELVQTVPFYRLFCNTKPTAAEIAYQTMKAGNRK